VDAHVTDASVSICCSVSSGLASARASDAAVVERRTLMSASVDQFMRAASVRRSDRR
jgi:hypothetical protein